jgi:hypothetical protein
MSATFSARLARLEQVSNAVRKPLVIVIADHPLSDDEELDLDTTVRGSRDPIVIYRALATH